MLNASLLAWQRNGTFFSTSASISHEEIETTTKITTLLITLTGEEFASEVYTYRCYTNNQITHQNTFSNSITIDPPGELDIYCRRLRPNNKYLMDKRLTVIDHDQYIYVYVPQLQIVNHLLLLITFARL